VSAKAKPPATGRRFEKKEKRISGRRLPSRDEKLGERKARRRPALRPQQWREGKNDQRGFSEPSIREAMEGNLDLGDHRETLRWVQRSRRRPYFDWK